MKDPTYERLRETAWRRNLTDSEKAELSAWLRQHPEHAAEWELEELLTTAVGSLPNAPVSTNFTSRVLQQLESEQRSAARRKPSLSRLRIRWLPRAALASVVLAAALFSYDAVQDSKRKTRANELKENVVAAFPGPEILADFDAIRAMAQAPAPDVDLLNALQ